MFLSQIKFGLCHLDSRVVSPAGLEVMTFEMKTTIKEKRGQRVREGERCKLYHPLE